MVIKKRRAIIRALKAARSIIAEGAERYVCCAINRAECMWILPRDDALLGLNYIAELLKPHSSVSGWLMENNPDFYRIHVNEMKGCTFPREYRLAWIDHMLKELRHGA